ncbi:MAG: hypothetical protein GQ570_11170 [Helicobacteraceae bacterium]|nr:hypothetical protein [Helicobacteraceae bacterium]
MLLELERPKILSQHVDTLYATFKTENEADYNRYINKELSKLEDFKTEAQNIEGFNNKNRFVKSNLFGGKFGSFKIFAQGSGQYRYLIENQDIFMSLSSAKFDSDAPLIKVQFSAHYLFAVGENKAYNYVLQLISQLLGTAFESSIQRIDLATDIQGVKIEYLDSIRYQNSYKNSVYRQGSKNTGLSFGGGSFMFRVYDKLEEIRSNYSRHYVKQKWALNGYREDDNLSVTRYEAQFRREALKKHIPKGVNEISYVFANLGSFWKKALQKIKYAPLTNDECIKIVDGGLKADSKRQVFKRARDNKDRFQFQEYLDVWDNKYSLQLIEYKEINEPIKATAKRQLKGFIASTMKACGNNPKVFRELINEVDNSLYEFENISLYDYGLLRTVDSFVHQSKMKEKYGVNCTINFDYTNLAVEAHHKLLNRFDDLSIISNNLKYVSNYDELMSYFSLEKQA